MNEPQRKHHKYRDFVLRMKHLSVNHLRATTNFLTAD